MRPARLKMACRCSAYRSLTRRRNNSPACQLVVNLLTADLLPRGAFILCKERAAEHGRAPLFRFVRSEQRDYGRAPRVVSRVPARAGYAAAEEQLTRRG